MISTRALTKRYGDMVALDRLDLDVAAGEIFGLIGPNGAGKTTTLRILATLLRPTDGTVRVGGVPLDGNGPRIRRLIGYMPDFAGVYEDMRVTEYLHFFAALANLPRRQAAVTVRDVLSLTELDDRRDAPVDTLSRGYRQRLGLARVLLHDPAVLLLDEPASGLDPRGRVEIRMLLKELRAMGKTVVISSHILSELAEVCTAVGILEHGRLRYRGSLADLLGRVRRGNVLHVRVGSPPPAGATEQQADIAAAEAVPATTPESASAETRRAREILLADPRIEAAELRGEAIVVRLRSDAGDPSFVPALLVERGFRLHHLTEEPLTLEDAFMRLTAERPPAADSSQP